MKSSGIINTARWVKRKCAHVFHALNPASRRRAAQWESAGGQECLQCMGIREGDFVIDFGCGPGRFCLPAAKLVGATGHVCAIDSNPDILRKVRRKAKALGLQNVSTAGSLAELRQQSGEHRYNLALAFDMLHFMNIHERNAIYRELQSILTNNGLLFVHPKHVKTDEPAKYFAAMSAEDVAREIEGTGYRLGQCLPLRIWHAHATTNSTVWSFINRIHV